MKPVKFNKKQIKSLTKVNSPNINDVLIVGDSFNFEHPKRTNRLVLILSGNYEINNRISNYWAWRDINEDGSLGKKNSGYGNFYRPKNKYNLILKVELENQSEKGLNGCYS